jgi:predicted HTH domain antitoxin
MSSRSLATAVALYHSRTLTLEQAATYCGRSTDRLLAEAQACSLPVHEELGANTRAAD